MTLILTSPDVSWVRECSPFRRLTRWNGRCAPTWSAAQCESLNSLRLSKSCPMRFCRPWPLSTDGLPRCLHPLRTKVVSLPSTGSIPPFAHVALPKDMPVIPSPSVRTYPSSSLNTPEASPHSVSTSPASSVSPQMPPNVHGPGFVKVVSADLSLLEARVIPHGHGSGHGPMLAKPVKALASVTPCFISCTQKAKDCARQGARAICVRDAGCLVITLLFASHVSLSALHAQSCCHLS
jgi:hypothetical protein